MTGQDVFGMYCEIEMHRFHSPNEFFTHKCMQSLSTNYWVDVPIKHPPTPTLHDDIEDCVRVICCGVEETEVYSVRREDAEFIGCSERTCINVSASSNFFRCGKCECEVMSTVDGWKPLYMGDVNYCLNCGRKVVDFCTSGIREACCGENQMRESERSLLADEGLV